MTRLLEAATFAADKHRYQRRKNRNASPYINHPLEVAHVLATDGGVDDVCLLMAALLHDTVEDTDATIDELTELFGAKVSELVAEVTDDKSLPKASRKALQVETASGKSDRAKQLKIADKICNVRDLDADSPIGWHNPRKLEYLEWSASVVHGCRDVNPALDQMFDREFARARQRLLG